MFVHHLHNPIHQYLIIRFHWNFLYFILLLLGSAKLIAQQSSIRYQIGNSTLQIFRIERFHNIGIGTCIHSFQRILYPWFCSQQYNRNMIYISILFQFMAQFQTIHFRHHYITDYQVGHFFQNVIICLLTITANCHFIFIRQFLLQISPDFLFIFDHQHPLTGFRLAGLLLVNIVHILFFRVRHLGANGKRCSLHHFIGS